MLEEWLSELKGKRVRLWMAQRGDRKRLLQMAQDNARERLASRRKFQEDRADTLERLQMLSLPRFPKRIAGIDISNLQGRHAVGSVVAFTDGKPDKNRYRRYRVRGPAQPDDPAMMAEIVERWLNEEPEIVEGVDLVVLDGGKGQLNRIQSCSGKNPWTCVCRSLPWPRKPKRMWLRRKGRLRQDLYSGRKNPHPEPHA